MFSHDVNSNESDGILRSGIVRYRDRNCTENDRSFKRAEYNCKSHTDMCIAHRW